jgi:hypothetical protein
MVVGCIIRSIRSRLLDSLRFLLSISPTSHSLKMMNQLTIDQSQVEKLIELLKRSHVPRELESSTLSFKWTNSSDELANAYFAIVAICHQTSPIGERALQGYVEFSTKKRIGWDYLKEKFLLAALKDEKWSDPKFWKTLTPGILSGIVFR